MFSAPPPSGSPTLQWRTSLSSGPNVTTGRSAASSWNAAWRASRRQRSKGSSPWEPPPQVWSSWTRWRSQRRTCCLTCPDWGWVERNDVVRGTSSLWLSMWTDSPYITLRALLAAWTTPVMGLRGALWVLLSSVSTQLVSTRSTGHMSQMKLKEDNSCWTEF